MAIHRKSTGINSAAALCLALTILVGCLAGPTEVIASMAEPMPVIETRGDDRVSLGPRIVIKSPISNRAYSNEVPIDVVFQRGPRGRAVNMESLRVIYRKFLPIDITDRVRDHVTANAIYVPNADLPVGNHEVEIYVEDMDRNWTRTRVRVKVVD